MVAALGAGARWRFVVYDEPIGDLDGINQYGPALLPNWLPHFTSLKLELEPVTRRKRRGLATEVLEDMSLRAAEHGGDAAVIRGAAAFLADRQEDHYDGPRQLVHLVQRAAAAQELAVQETDFPDSRMRQGNGKYRDEPHEAGIFVVGDELRALLHSKSQVPPDPLTMATPDSHSYPPVAQRHEIDGERGWVIKADFWKQEVERHRKAERRRRRAIRALHRRHDTAGVA